MSFKILKLSGYIPCLILNITARDLHITRAEGFSNFALIPSMLVALLVLSFSCCLSFFLVINPMLTFSMLNQVSSGIIYLTFDQVSTI